MEGHRLLTDQVDLVNPEGYPLVPDVSKPLPLEGPPGQLKAANYPDIRLEELVPSLWIESERDYNISAAYGINGGLSKRNSTSLDIVPPLIIVQSDITCGFSVLSVSRHLKDTVTPI
nr:hypothetical protein [Tanacetum cinerariifolium]